MYRDPIIAQVRKDREAMVREAGGDLDKYLEGLRRAQEQYKERLVDILPGRTKQER